MKLETAVIQVEVVNGCPIPRRVRLGDRLILNTVSARIVAEREAPVRLELQVNVAEARTEVLREGTPMSCEAGVARVGETPALGYTVGELIDRLSQYPRNAPVGMNVGPGSNLEILSLYQATEPPEVVWFDLGEQEPA